MTYTTTSFSRSESYLEEQIKIEKALADGISRPVSVKAEYNQSLTYILSKSKLFHHATLESASAEKYFLQAALGRKLRIYKIWNVGRDEVKDDLYMLIAMLDETEVWDPAFEALDRVMKGAGF
ncbi:hypothetical protein N9W89_12190 [Hellea sp.]|nr:hypothetical protein [Hellea sp.]